MADDIGYPSPGWRCRERGCAVLPREKTGMTLRELGDAAGGMDYAAVCMGLRRFDLRMGQQKKGGELNDNYRRICEMLDV